MATGDQRRAARVIFELVHLLRSQDMFILYPRIYSCIHETALTLQRVSLLHARAPAPSRPSVLASLCAVLSDTTLYGISCCDIRHSTHR